MTTPSILLIGATGRLGIQLIHKAAHASPPLPLHAFARTPAKLPPTETNLCASVIAGDARSSHDIKQALRQCNADIVVMAVGVPDSHARTDVREATARALVEALADAHDSSRDSTHDSTHEFKHVKVVLVSSTGAGGTKIEIGMGLGKVLAFMLRHVMADHDRQEAAAKKLGMHRLLIVRPTGLTDGKGGKKVVEYGAKAPTSQIDREDVAGWIVGRMVQNKVSGEYNITKGR